MRRLTDISRFQAPGLGNAPDQDTLDKLQVD